MKKVIRLTESELVNLVKKVIKEQSTEPPKSSQTLKVSSWTPELEKADLSCVDAKLFTQKSGDGKTYYAYDLPSAVSGGVAERVVLYSDGSGNIIARGAHNKGRWKCGTNGVEFRADADRQSVRYLGKVQAPAAAAPAANTTNCAASLAEIKKGGIKVLKFGCSTEAVKELQKLLGMETRHQTGYFGNITKAKVIEFQRANKDPEGKQLKDDGIVGDKTYSVMAYKNLTSGNVSEQATDKLITPTSKQSEPGKLKSMSDTMSKSNSESWFSNFPCLNEVPQSKRQMVNGNVVLSTAADGTKRILLPKSGKGDPAYRYVENYKPINDYVGQIQGGGVYYCSSEAYAKGFGPQTMKMK